MLIIKSMKKIKKLYITQRKIMQIKKLQQLQPKNFMKELKKVLLILTLATLSCLISSKSWSQSTLKNKTVTQTDVKWLVGIINKQDSLLAAKDLIVNELDKQVTQCEEIHTKLKEQITLKSNNETLYQDAIKIIDADYTKLSKENKRLKFQVKLFKGISIGLPALGVAAAGYFIFIK